MSKQQTGFKYRIVFNSFMLLIFWSTKKTFKKGEKKKGEFSCKKSCF